MGSDQREAEQSKNDHISIHAPAWGATRLKVFCLLGGHISIHAPAWGATAHFISI